jgi:hypothetical protein
MACEAVVAASRLRIVVMNVCHVTRFAGSD